MNTDARKIAVIGAGPWGKNIIKTLHDMDALSAVAEQNPEVCHLLKEQYPDIEIYQNYQDLLKTDIDAVAVATPVFTHANVAQAVLEADKDVFVEKPLSVDSVQGRRLVELAKAKQRLLMVGHMLMYQPAIRFIKSFIASGELGKIYNYHQVRRNLGTVRSQENALYSLGVHDLAVLDYLINEEVERLQVEGQSITTPGIEDSMVLHLTYESGVRAHLHVCWLWPDKERNLMILGEKGALYFDELAAQVVHFKNYVNPDLSITRGGSQVVFQGDSQPLRLEMEHFMECLENRTMPHSSGEQGVRVVSILEEASRLLAADKNQEGNI